jgi:hypothetical protein
MRYYAGSFYHFRFVINPITAHYDVYVTRPGQTEVALATDYAFRSEQSATSRLNNWDMIASTGSVTICNMAIVSNSGPPAITMQPAGQTVVDGQAATFSVTATGTAPLSYQWRKNGVNISGATSSSYTTPATTSADTGAKFRVVIANSAGSVTSNAATLTVNTTILAPSITTQPASQTVIAGQSATFSIVVTGTGPLNYEWRKNGATIIVTNMSSYTTPPTTTADSGSIFSVRVYNSAGSVTSTGAMLTVSAATVAPAITTQPAGQTVVAGQAATFSVAATGTAPLSYQWTRNGANISGATSSSYTTPATTTADSGANFAVAVRNSAGSATSNSATLTVNVATRLLTANPAGLNFGNVTLLASSLLTSTLTNTGNSSVTISNVSISGAGVSVSGLSTGQVLLPGQTATLNVTYLPLLTGILTGSAVVTSNAGNSPTAISLSGTGVQLVSHSVILSWMASSSSVVGYNVYSSTLSGGPYTRLTASPATTASYKDATVQSGKTYYYVVTAVDSGAVESGYSNQVTAVIP